jgi:Lon protease-like protein
MTSKHSRVRLFPLTGTLLLPGTFLPLNVFESRYRRLVADVMDDDRRIGIVQPLVPADDNFGLAAGAPERPPLYDVGCLGEVVECDPQSDGRYWIVLRGESRFRLVEELPGEPGGYRRCLADRSAFAEDRREIAHEIDIGELLGVAVRFCDARRIDFDIDLLAALPPAQAVNALCAALPFEPAEKQALLEAAGPEARRDLLAGLLEMQLGAMSFEAPPSYEPPTVH